ncbi:MAG: serine protease [Bryobacteraceae bacterium]|nr:serine protease [Bryobacteraceae bacterium]
MPSGLHTPVTNIVSTETTIAEERISQGDSGQGDELTLLEGASDENLPVMESLQFESAEVFELPDTSNLPDVGVASFGPPAQFESVFGPDERVQIQETKKLPWRLSASLVITAADNSQWIGTGWFISPRTLVTAGHCVFIKNSGIPGRDGFAKKIQVIPGRNASQAPFGAITATEFFTVKGWADSGLEVTDYGAIILPSAFSQNLGSFSFGVMSDATLLNSVANIAGYPGDKPSGTIWYDKRKVGSVKPEKVFYSADTAGGQSGACVYVIRNRKRIGIAIHAYGGQTSNSGTRISADVFDNLMAWKRS